MGWGSGEPFRVRVERAGGLSRKETHFLVASEDMEKDAPRWGSLREEPLVLSKDHGGRLEGLLEEYWRGKLLAVVPLGASGLTPGGRHRPERGTV